MAEVKVGVMGKAMAEARDVVKVEIGLLFYHVTKDVALNFKINPVQIR
jgi:hypothetical protein